MARIRTIKPELLTDETAAALSDGAWRLFVSCISLADDYGNLRASVGLLTGQVWWAHRNPPRVAAILRELQESGLVVLYTVRKQQYLHLKGWEKHQRVDNASKPIVPQPSDPDAVMCVEFAAARREPPRLAAGLDQGREGKGREGDGSAGAGAPAASPRPTRSRKPPELDPDEQAAVAGVLDKLSRETGIQYRPDSRTHARLIVGRLREGVTEDELRAVIVHCADPKPIGLGWRGDDKMHVFLRPDVLFGPSNIEKYLPAARALLAQAGAL